MANPALSLLFDKYLLGTISVDELHQLQGYIQAEENQAVLDQLLEQAFANSNFSIAGDDDPQEMYEAFLDRLKGRAIEKEEEEIGAGTLVIAMRRRRRYFRIAAAAIILLVAGIGIYAYLSRRPVIIEKPNVYVTRDVRPGGNRAILILSGGRRLVLDSTTADTVLTEGSAIIAGATGKLAYQTGNHPAVTAMLNTLATPRGGQYQLTLSDGTRVWLNAASSITYPTAFTGAHRNVTITGEAYFEVMKDVSRPFTVNVNGKAEVEVLGTDFNINAYEDEADIKATLLTGSVKVLPGVPVNTGDDKMGLVLKPGQQAQLAKTEKIKVLDAVDFDEVMAWKNGLFSFTDADLPTVMRQLARWYNIDVTYEGAVPNQQFNGKIGKNLTLSEVLDILAKSSVRYSIEPGNKLIIRRP